MREALEIVIREGEKMGSKINTEKTVNVNSQAGSRKYKN